MPEAEDRRKHLEFVEAVIARQASNSFLVKGWGLTVATVAFAFAVKENAWEVAAVGVLAVLAFWYLDSFFLRQERLFRCLYNAVIDAEGEEPIPAYSMDTTPFKDVHDNLWPQVLRRRTVSLFFGVLVLAGVLSAGAAASAQPADEPKDCRKDSASSSNS